jgi:hypothetical protein
LKSTAPKIISPMQAQLDISSTCNSTLVRGLNLLSLSVSHPGNLLRIVSGSHRLLPYALEFWIEHCLHYASAGGPLNLGQSASTCLSQLHDTHEQFSGKPDTVESSDGSAEVMEDYLDHRLKLFTHVPAHDLMRKVLHARWLASQQHCENGEGKSDPVYTGRSWYIAHTSNTPDVEKFIIQSDRTHFSKMSAEFDRAIIHLLSQSEVAGIPRAVLATFQESYASTAFRCRYPYCTRASAGFASLHLRAQHEEGHLQRVYCNETSCQYSRIGFAKKNGLNAHTRKFHKEITILPIPAKVRRSKEGSETDIVPSTRYIHPAPGTFHTATQHRLIANHSHHHRSEQDVHDCRKRSDAPDLQATRNPGFRNGW